MSKLKYEFKYISLDKYELIYTDKNKKEVVIPFTRTVEMATKLQGIEKRARLSMYKDLTEQGMTKEDLIVKKEKIVNGKTKTIFDETNYKLYEKEYLDVARYEIINEIYRMCFKMELADLLKSMGVDEKTNPSDVQLFSEKFALIIAGKNKEESPSEEKQN